MLQHRSFIQDNSSRVLPLNKDNLDKLQFLQRCWSGEDTVDLPYKETFDVVDIYHKAGIRVFMVASYFSLTIASIAKQCHIVTSNHIYSIEDMRNNALQYAPGAFAGTAGENSGHKQDDATSISTNEVRSLVLSGSELAGLQAKHWDIICNYSEIVFAHTMSKYKLPLAFDM
ncbi:hypothetical protein GGI25_006425 [Coemansia spiralis]|uniref:Uncharacterized protein n=2 Tax=Coemansia TaxID=4863 RepID=A0A9W8KVI4_9FUNG|nr:hypothetical protein EDC05_006464 [Coemansia umbellata]KAJ2668535.1 hypothetical protein GGI25_006425 [Coemansia spiralis]